MFSLRHVVGDQFARKHASAKPTRVLVSEAIAQFGARLESQSAKFLSACNVNTIFLVQIPCESCRDLFFSMK
jgi:hypothetical protein